MTDERYIRELGCFMVKVKKLTKDKAPTGQHYDVVVLEDDRGRLIDAKFAIDKNFDRTGVRYNQGTQKAFESFVDACGGDVTKLVGQDLIILVAPKDSTTGKRYWNVSGYWPVSEWSTQQNNVPYDPFANDGGTPF